MKKNHRTLTCLLVGLAVVTMPAVGNAAADCSEVTRAAQSGLGKATDPLKDIEDKTADKVKAATTCVETFNEVAGRLSMTPAGYDLAPARKLLVNASCRVINKEINKKYNELYFKAATKLDEAQEKVLDAAGKKVRDKGIIQETAGSAANRALDGAAEKVKPGIWEAVSCQFGKC